MEGKLLKEELWFRGQWSNMVLLLKWKIADCFTIEWFLSLCSWWWKIFSVIRPALLLNFTPWSAFSRQILIHQKWLPAPLEGLCSVLCAACISISSQFGHLLRGGHSLIGCVVRTRDTQTFLWMTLLHPVITSCLQYAFASPVRTPRRQPCLRVFRLY